MNKPFSPGDKVYVHDQFDFRRATIKTVKNGCNCCDLYENEFWFYEIEEDTFWHEESYVSATQEEALYSLGDWESSREWFFKYKVMIDKYEAHKVEREAIKVKRKDSRRRSNSYL
jgi:hypothetical protein